MTLFARLIGFFMVIGLAWPVRAQPVVRIDSLPPEGVLLRSGWRWHSGDNPAWASPDLPDNRWDSIRPTRSIMRLPAVQQSGISWLRLTFDLDSAVAAQPLQLQLDQVGAGEFYVDGALWQRLGRIGTAQQSGEAYLPNDLEHYRLPTLSPGRHTLAVRMALYPPAWYTPKQFYWQHSLLTVRLIPTYGSTPEEVGQLYRRTLVNYLIVGLFLMMSAIHFMYYTYRRQPVNLTFGLTTLFCSASLVTNDLLGRVSSLPLAEWTYFGQGMIVVLFMTSLLATYYLYLKQPLSWIFWTVAALLIVPRLVFYFTSISLGGGMIFLIGSVALFVDGVRVSIEAVRARRPNARLVLYSILTLITIMIVGGGISIWLERTQPAGSEYLSVVTSVINFLFFLVLPLSFAVILAREYAQTSRDLEERLTDVRRLSAEKETLLTDQKERLEQQVAERTAALTQSLTDLRDAQQQLVQREKMASLGELTAGIAHEIQNPLNFVNNFAEVSVELVGELREERQKGDERDGELEDEILGDLTQNLEKISQHGQRAAGIVRGMLNHSRTSSGQREPTNLNALADEYLKLAYHGLRASDSQFNAQLITRFDPDLGRVSVVPQDMGRVLLNLFNNAFYAVREKQKLAPADYQPTLTVQTKRLPDTVEIRVIDNGIGVPESIRDKLFNPFFTTKPTGQGTGLGLSLSYDIVTKGHGGTLELAPDEGDTQFIIRLPVR